VKETFTNDLAQTRRWAQRLAANPFFGPMTNPEPGISPDQLHEIRPDAYYGSGNQTYENTVNNFTAFGYIGAGSLMAMAGGVGPGMTVAAAHGISKVARMGPSSEMRDRLPKNQQEFGQHWLVPHPEDIRLISEEAGAVARAAAREGLAILLGTNPTPEALAQFDAEIKEKVRFRTEFVQEMRERMALQGRRYLDIRYPDRNAPFWFKENPQAKPVGFDVAPEVDRSEFEHYARQMGVEASRWEGLLEDGNLKPTALTEALHALLPSTQADTPQAELAARELKFIAWITDICPALGLALAVRRARVRAENLEKRPTLFHRVEVLRVLYQVIPEARRDIERAFQGVPDLP
jgi:hypothetical protein